MQAVIGTFDSFFYYGQNDLVLECINDVSETILQPKNAMFYDRANGTDLAATRNNPRGGMLDFLMRFDIAAAIARRNNEVSDGSGNTKDRRVAASQSSVEITYPPKGGAEVTVSFITFSGLKNVRNLGVSLPAGATGG